MTNKVKIYTFAHNRPDFIQIQFNTFKKYIQDDFEFTVFNNEKPGSHGGFNENRKQEIFDTCEKLNLKCIEIELSEDLRILNNQAQFINDAYVNGNTACSYPFTWAWKNYVVKDEGISILIDSDMFLCNYVSFNKMMEGYNFAYVPSYRNNCTLKYPWNGLVFAKPKEMPNPEELSWGCGYVNETPVDVGGEAYSYLIKYKNQLQTLYLDQWGILVDNQNPFELSLNGCAQYFANFDTLELSSGEIQAKLPPEEKTFPHQINREDYWDYFYQNYSKIKEIVEYYKFPKPTFIDFLKLEKDDSIEKSFVFHYKAGSNYMPWANEKYNQEKTSAFYQLLGV